MIIETLYPHTCSFFGDNGNLMILKASLPKATFIEDHFNQRPYFAKNKPDMLLMGGMSENTQEKVISELVPYRQNLIDLISKGTIILFTSNAIEILFTKIIDKQKEIECLNIYPLIAKRQMNKRINCHYIGTDENNNTIMGFKAQFTLAYGDNPKPWLLTKKGIGFNYDDKVEGIKDNNLYATYLLGPILTMNPNFTKHILKLLTKKDNYPLAFEKEAQDAYKRHLKEFLNPKTIFIEK